MKAIRSLLLAALLATAPFTAKAALLDFTFSFTNLFGPYTGTVTGIVRGLTDNATSAASSFEVLSNTDGFGLGEYVGNPFFNTWTVTNGVITDYFFDAFGRDNTPPAVTCCFIQLVGLALNGAALGPDDGSAFFLRPVAKDIVFSAVPEPSSALILAAALGLAGFATRRRQPSGA